MTRLPFVVSVVVLTACNVGGPDDDRDASARPMDEAPSQEGVEAPHTIALSEDVSCNPVTGLNAPVPLCSASRPCTNPSPLLGVDVIATSSPIPSCTTTRADHPTFDDGPPRVRTDAEGVPRYACEYRPPGTSARSPRPLLVWMHGGGGSADGVYDTTLLRQKASQFGFILLSVQGRYLRSISPDIGDGVHHDTWYRDLASPSSNPDIANVDSLIDELVAEDIVDGRRIYIAGHSNGGFFAQMYAIARHDTPTPGGSRVAAAVAYSAGDPFHHTSYLIDGSCELSPYPNSKVPILMVSRSCDMIACNEAQHRRFLETFLTTGSSLTQPGWVVETWMDDLSDRMGNPNGRWLLLNAWGRPTRFCALAAACSYPAAVLNHIRWPDGIGDNSGNDHEFEMLTFMQDHPLP